jgi:hypothetical protein
MASIDKIGMDIVGRLKWRELIPSEKYRTAYEAVTNETNSKKNLDATSFPDFLLALYQCVGSSKVQLDIIQKQLSVALKHVKVLDSATVDELCKIIRISEHLGLTNTQFHKHFWDAYKSFMKKSIEIYKSEMDHQVFIMAMTQLAQYDSLLRQVGADESERRKVVDEMVYLVRVQIKELLKFASLWPTGSPDSNKASKLCYYDTKNKKWEGQGQRTHNNYDDDDFDGYQATSGKTRNKPPYDNAHHWEHIGTGKWRNKYTMKTSNTTNNPVSQKSIWYDQSLFDFKVAFESILLLSYHKSFCLNFGQEKIRMEEIVNKFNVLKEYKQRDICYRTMFDYIAGTYNDDGEFVPDIVDKYNIFVHFKMPEHLSDPSHWGHLTWMFCEFMEKTYP